MDLGVFRRASPGAGCAHDYLIRIPVRARDADVYIPIGIPGIDHPGNLFRTDSVINMPLKKVRDSAFPSAARVIREIISGIEDKPE